jgi:hypothetical protein
VDLESNRPWHRLSDGDLTPRRLVRELELLIGQPIVPGKTLLFFDEIQACPCALASLRCFFEEAPDLHVVAAGSLLDFAPGEISFPVGRLQVLELHPLTFAEFLQAIGQEPAARIVLSPPAPVTPVVHEKLQEDLRTYCLAGGMPECVRTYAERRSIRECFDVQRELCESYRQDFPEHGPRMNREALDAVLTVVLVGGPSDWSG